MYREDLVLVAVLPILGGDVTATIEARDTRSTDIIHARVYRDFVRIAVDLDDDGVHRLGTARRGELFPLTTLSVAGGRAHRRSCLLHCLLAALTRDLEGLDGLASDAVLVDALDENDVPAVRKAPPLLLEDGDPAPHATAHRLHGEAKTLAHAHNERVALVFAALSLRLPRGEALFLLTLERGETLFLLFLKRGASDDAFDGSHVVLPTEVVRCESLELQLTLDGQGLSAFLDKGLQEQDLLDPALRSLSDEGNDGLIARHGEEPDAVESASLETPDELPEMKDLGEEEIPPPHHQAPNEFELERMLADDERSDFDFVGRSVGARGGGEVRKGKTNRAHGASYKLIK